MKPVSSFCVLIAIILFNIGCKDKSGTKSGNSDGNTVLAKADSSLEAINQRILDDPGNFQNYLDRAKYFGAKSQYKDALDDIDRALRADSTKGDIYLFRGEIYWFQKNVDGAYKEYEHCLRFESQNEDCLLKKAAIDIALANFDIALEHINTALQQDEQLPYAYYLKGRLYREIGDTTLSASSYQTAIELNPDFYDAYIEVALLYAAKRSDLALEYYTTAIGIQPNSVEAWYNKAMYLQENAGKNRSKLDQAFKCYDQIEIIDPQNATANFNKGYIHLELLGQFDSAAAEFTTAIQKFPGYSQAYYNRGLCYESLSNKASAENDYRAALKIQPTYDDAAKALSRVRGE